MTPRAVYLAVAAAGRVGGSLCDRLAGVIANVADLLAQALINLLRNAAQASGEHGRVRLALRPDAIEVEDDGPGVPANLRNDVFLPFFTTRGNGTGVGLNLVRQIVVAHGWTIELGEGALGGALFRIGGV